MICLKDILSETFDSKFESWFNGSVVVDKDEKPLRMFHGTHAKENFSIFNTELRGAWFTANPKEAGAYAGGGDLNSTKKYGRTIPVFLNIKNPKKFTIEEFDQLIDDWVRYNSYKKGMVDLKKKAIAEGYDGFYLQGSARDRDIYVAFYQSQIKNAITLNELDYPLAGKSDLQSYGGMDGWKGKVVYMSPDKFLRLAAPLPDWAINKEGLKKIEDRMKGQLPLDFCVLEVNMKTRTVTGHEGRHRCIAAKKLGIEKVPVLIYTGSSFDRVPQWNQSTHDDIDKADFNPQLKEEESVASTFKMYHGGSRWSYLPDDIQPGKKNHYEAGVGIYFTNSYNTARKYAKGNKVVHLVEIDKQFKDIENVRVAVEKITDFVKTVPQLSSKNDIIKDLVSYSTRVGKTEIPLSILNNLVVNYQAARGKSGVYIAKFFSENGADGHVQKQGGNEIWLVVFNPKILKSVKVVNPKEINSDSQFMLPGNLTENSSAEWDAIEDFSERRDNELMYLCRSLKNSGGKGRVTWKTVSASLLKRVWYQFGKYQRINSNDLDKISDQILTNIARLRASTEMMGHAQMGKQDIEDETGYEFTDEEWDDWMTSYFTDLNGSWLLSDYGLPKLEAIYPSIFNAKTDEEKLYACDRALNVIHQRNDLASMFVEGGSKTLLDVARQGGYSSDT